MVGGYDMDRLKRLEQILGKHSKPPLILERVGNKYLEKEPSSSNVLNEYTAGEMEQLQESRTIVIYTRASGSRYTT